VFGATAQVIECASAEGALSEVGRGRAAFAVFPLESTVEGVHQTALMTLAETDLVLVGERVLGATYELMSLAREAAVLEKVYVTALAHAACQRFLDEELPRVTIIDVRSPQVAAELSRETETSAAIVPEQCGLKAGLTVLRGNVNDVADLKCRYAVAGQRPAARTGHDVCCLLFATDNQPGALYDVLRHFAERGINLRKLQTLPVRRDGLEYYFYAEVNGHASDRPVVTALEAVKRGVRYFRLLGSFPSGV
jgi:chorismate mutase/prephenate dehydratase